MKSYVKEVGPIAHVVSDNASCFISENYYEGMEKLGIDTVHISPYNPQANLAERMIGRIGNMLRLKIAGNPHNRWFEHVNSIEEIINRMEHTVTLATPWELQFEQPIQDELAELLDLPTDNISINRGKGKNR